MPPSRRVTETTSKNGRPAIDRLAALVGGNAGKPVDRPVDRVVGEPRSCRVAADPVERHAGGERSHAPCLHGQVGRLEQDREIGLVDERARVEERRQRVVARRELLPAEQEQRDVDGPGLGSREVAHELERDGDAALHVARAASVHRAVGDPAGNVVLGRHGVVVAREHEQRDVRRAARAPTGTPRRPRRPARTARARATGAAP